MKKKIQSSDKLREEAATYASIRLARGNLRIQSGAFATASEWKERQQSQAARMQRINEKLK